MADWSDQEFDAFVVSRLARLVRFGYALTGDLGHAEDVVQTALAKTYAATRRRTLDDPNAYVRAAVVTANLSRFRRRRVVEDLVDVVPETVNQETESELKRREAVRAMVTGLSPRQRTVLVLRYEEDWFEQEIAAAMGVSPGTVKTLTSRAMARLRDTVRPEERTDA